MKKKIVVPEGMLKAGMDAIRGNWAELVPCILEASLRWLAENPIVPTDEQMDALTNEVPYQDSGNGGVFHVVIDKWQRRMFLASELEVPEEVGDLMYPDFVNAIQMVTGEQCTRTEKRYRQSVIEAYRRGKESK